MVFGGPADEVGLLSFEASPLAVTGEGQVTLKAVIDGASGRRHEIKVIQRPQQQQSPIQPA